MMKNILITILLLVLVTAVTYAQKYSKEYGVIAKDEIELKKYSLDPDAEAVVLFDIGKSYFARAENTFDVVYERSTRIKILADAGTRWAEVVIPFYHEGQVWESVYEIEAMTYNFENGAITKTPFDPSNTYDEKISEYWSVKKFVLPNVREGSVIEYRYKIYSEYKFNFRDWEFQWKIPVVYSEYEVKMIPIYEYTFIFQGAKKFDLYETFQDKGLPRHFGPANGYCNNEYYDMVYKFGMINVPAFRDEEFISSPNDYIIKLDFQLSRIQHFDGTSTSVITTWEDLITELIKHQDFGKYLSKAEKSSSKLLDTEEIDTKTEAEKFDAVIDYAKKNFSWDSHADKFASKSPNDLINDKFGNCADLNLFAIAMLNAIGIEAYPVILSTRDHGKIHLDYPFSHFFNYVIILAKIDGKTILSDATEVFCMNDRIPPRCINDKGLIIKKDTIEWIGLEFLFTSTKNTALNIKINGDDLEVDLLLSGSEYDALYFRNTFTDNAELVKQKITSDNYRIIDSSIVVQNQSDKSKPYKLSYSIEAKPEIINDKIYISPFMDLTLNDNPLKQKDRKYPLDMVYPTQRVLNSTLTIPEGYTLDFIPEDLNLSNELFELDYSVNAMNDKVQAILMYQFKNPIYQATDYTKIKSFFNQMIKKGNEKIVVVKKQADGN